MSGITYGSCCYLDCPNSYSAEADVVFFKFPMDTARRKKWIENIGNPEISQLSDRQLRGKRVCASHFDNTAFTNANTKDALTDKAIPLPLSKTSKVQKKSTSDTDKESDSTDDTEAQKSTKDDKDKNKDKEPEDTTPSTSITATPIVRRGPGRPPKRDSLALSTPNSTPLLSVKSESSESVTPISKMTRSKAAIQTPAATTPSTTADDKDKEKVFKVEPILSVEPVLSKPTRGRRASASASLVDLEPPVLKEILPDTTITLSTEEPTPSSSTMATTPKRTTRSSAKDSPGTKADKEILPPILEDQTQITVVSFEKKTRASTAPVKVELVEAIAKPIEPKRKSISVVDEERTVKKMKVETKDPLLSTPTPVVVPIIERKTLTPQAQLRIQKAKEEFERKGHKGEKVKPIPTDPIKQESTPKRYVESQTVFEAFCSIIKSRCILPEEWNFSGILTDPSHKLKFMSIWEVDVGQSKGPIKMKRVVQIYDDFTVKVWSDGINVSHRFDAKKVHTESDVSHLLAKVMSAKICQGLRGFTEADQSKYPSTIQRDGCWYSCQCQVIVEKGHAGNVCPSCVRLRNTMRRKKGKSNPQGKSKISTEGKSTLETGLYNFLSKLADEEESHRLAANKAKAMILLGERDGTSDNIPGDSLDFPSVGTSKANKVSSGLRRPSRPAIKTRRPIKMMGDGQAMPNLNSPFTILSATGHGNTGDGTTGIPKEIMDYITAQGGNIGDIVIQQNGTEFDLGGGHQFEILGESGLQSHESGGIQVLEADENSGIQIIEVDDQTLAQLQAQNIGGMFSFTDNPNIQVTEIDGNDPNSALLKVINNPQYFIQQHGGT